MAIDFPTSPTTGQIYTINNVTYEYDGVKWVSIAPNDVLATGGTINGDLEVNGALTNNGSSVWHTGNDGSGSGLDADTVDGKHASEFSLTSHSHTASDVGALPSSGGTVSGQLTAGNGIKVNGSADHSYAGIKAGPSAQSGHLMIDPVGSGNVYICWNVGGDVRLNDAGGNTMSGGNITAYYSDGRLKENVTPISNAIDKVKQISGVTYNSNELAASFGYKDKKEQVGVISQEIEKVLPQIVSGAPFDTEKDENGNYYSKSGDNYKTVSYEKITPLLIEAIKEQQITIDKQQAQIDKQQAQIDEIIKWLS